jgi:hypothetical protein
MEMDRDKIANIVMPYIEIITPHISLEQFLSEAFTYWYCELPAEKRKKVLDGICKRIDKHNQKCIAQATIFVEQTWVKILRLLDQKLERGEISLAKYYAEKDFMEFQLSNLDTLSIAENFERRKVG